MPPISHHPSHASDHFAPMSRMRRPAKPTQGTPFAVAAPAVGDAGVRPHPQALLDAATLAALLGAQAAG